MHGNKARVMSYAYIHQHKMWSVAAVNPHCNVQLVSRKVKLTISPDDSTFIASWRLRKIVKFRKFSCGYKLRKNTWVERRINYSNNHQNPKKRKKKLQIISNFKRCYKQLPHLSSNSIIKVVISILPIALGTLRHLTSCHIVLLMHLSSIKLRNLPLILSQVGQPARLS